MQLLSTHGNGRVAVVRTGLTSRGSRVEFVESLQPPRPIEDKWVLIISTLKGCPVKCPICDAGGSYAGRLTADELLEQIDCMVTARYPDRVVPCRQFKIQFSRVGDPAFNPGVLEALRALPRSFNAPGLMPSISTIAPKGSEAFLEQLAPIKDKLYPNGAFQMQFSLHTSCEDARRTLVPWPTLPIDYLADWGRRFHKTGDRRITLNFAAVRGYPIDPAVLAGRFSPDHFMVKLTPVNPTAASRNAGLVGVVDPDNPADGDALAAAFAAQGFETLVSIGELEENQIGSNCGMYLATYTPDEKCS